MKSRSVFKSAFMILNNKCVHVTCKESSTICKDGCRDYIIVEDSCEFCNNCNSC